MSSCENWVGDRFFSGDELEQTVSMKPLMMLLLREAFWIAVCDSLPDATVERRREICSGGTLVISDEEWAQVSPGVLSRNIGIRLMGSGGFTVRGVYSGNATDAEDVAAVLPDLARAIKES